MLQKKLHCGFDLVLTIYFKLLITS